MRSVELDAVRWQADVVLADGGVAHLRPIQPTDGDALVRFHAALSDRSRYFRFFSPHPRLSTREVERFTTVDMTDRVALIAEVEGEILGVGRFDRRPGADDAEVAFVVADAHQGRGVATVLLEYLAAMARERGITLFTAEVLPNNRAMLNVFASVGFEGTRTFGDGVMHVDMLLSGADDALDKLATREHAAEARSVARLLAPSSLAVIGASRSPGTVGNALLTNLQNGGFTGQLYAVNPSTREINGVRAYRSVLDIPGPVDLAVVAVRPELAPRVFDECGSKGVRGVVVVSGGFAETGDEGLALQRELVRRARWHGMRVIGPNCLGVVNTASDVSMNATFAAVPVLPGNAGFMTQSGALGIAFLAEAARSGLGVSTFVSVGNKADLSGNDMLQYWEDDEATSVVLLYLESFGNPRKFARLTRRLSSKKPVVALKSGRSSSGRQAARSHTAALASADSAVDALFEQAGVIRVDTLSEMLDVAKVSVACPRPQGARLAIVGNSGGPGIMAADAAAAAGLTVAELSDQTRAALRKLLGTNASVTNPVDTTAGVDAGTIARAVEVVCADPGVDVAVTVFTPTLIASSDAVAEALLALPRPGVPVAAAFLATDPLPTALDGHGMPTFRMPEEAVAAMGHVALHAAWTRRPQGSVPTFDDIDAASAATLVGDFLKDHPTGGWVDPETTAAVLTAYGIPVVRSIEVHSAEAATEAAESLSGPVAVKAIGPTIVHKSDAGGVALDILPTAAGEVYEAMAARFGDAFAGGLVQPMVTSGVETIVGVVHDEPFGPLVMFGLGGTAAELLGDRSFRALPLTDLDADGLVRSIRSAPLLFGYRGTPLGNVGALEGVLLRVAQLAGDLPELAELDLNPVIVSKDAAQAVDVRMRLAPQTPPSELRSLRRES